MSYEFEHLLWCDLETTGLKPSAGQILEAAFIITTPDLQELGRKQVIMKPEIRGDMDLRVVEMHTKSGLLAECFARGLSAHDAHLEVVNWLRFMISECKLNFSKVYLAGSTIHFDRGWLLEHMEYVLRPTQADRLSYRNFDVSNLAALAATYPAFAKHGLPKSDAEPAHRALPDLEYSMSVFRQFLERGSELLQLEMSAIAGDS